MPKLSIVIPHKHEPENDKALAQALVCIVQNTRSDYELLVDTTTPADPYVVLNSLVARASGEYIFFSNSDIFVAPGWDTPMLAAAAPDTIVNATLVEPGAIGVHQGNIHRDFGMTPETFKRREFEAFCATNPQPPNNAGFYYYAVIHRQAFLDFGSFDTTRGEFPTPLDIFFWTDWEKAGKKIIRGLGLIYHLQRYSLKEEQDKPVRYGQPGQPPPVSQVPLVAADPSIVGLFGRRP